MSVYAPLLGVLWRTIESYGADPGLVIDASVYRPDRKTMVAERIKYSDFDTALFKAQKLVEDPAIGIRTARFMHPSYFGVLGHAWLVSFSLRTALKRFERSQALLDENCQFRVHELDDRILLTYSTNREQTCRDEVDDFHQAQLFAMCRLNFGAGLEPTELHLRRPLPKDPTPWLEFFGPMVEFEQPEVTMAFSNKQADTPLSVSNSELVMLHDATIRRHLLKLHQNNILNLSRMRLAEQLPFGRVTENDLARDLNMSTRTLHRKLRENNETFRSLLEQVRIELAGRYIRNRSYTVTEIAFLLGYTDISSFSRAFKGWFGRSPSLAREQR